MANSPHVKINLIGKPKESFFQNFLKWSISAGRFIIVTTELIALAALLYRFNVDRQLIDLHDEIEKEELFVSAQKNQEIEFRSIQNRLKYIKDIEDETKTKVAIMNEALDLASKGNFSSTNISVNQNTINLNGIAFSVFPINDFIKSMKTNPNVTSISMDEIASTPQGIQFKISVELKNNKKYSNEI